MLKVVVSERNDESLSRGGLCCVSFCLESLVSCACVWIVRLVCIDIYRRSLCSELVARPSVDLEVLHAGLKRGAIKKGQ